MRVGLRLIVPARIALGTHRLPAGVEILIYFFTVNKPFAGLMGEYFGDAVIITLPVITIFTTILFHIFPLPMVFALVRPGPCNVRLRPRLLWYVRTCSPSGSAPEVWRKVSADQGRKLLISITLLRYS